MASATALPLRRIALGAGLALAVGAFKSKPLLESFFTGPGSYSRIACLLVVLANYKNFPFVWHIRVWNSILHHFFASHTFTPELAGLTSSKHLPALFRPSITPSRSPVSECDYNLHKSNSTYFSDLDAARGHCICALTHTAITKLQNDPSILYQPDGKPCRGRWGIMLGAVHCSWKREIKPYEGYEMWSRLLCWDRKWFYVVTHFVKKGSTRPIGYTLDAPGDSGILPSWLKSKKGRTVKGFNREAGEIDEKVIFASAISKYVMKIGRLTIHPEAILDLSGVLPAKPGGWNDMRTPPTTPGTPEEEDLAAETMMGDSAPVHFGIANGTVEAEKTNGHVNGAANENGESKAEVEGEEKDEGWTWQMIEEENAKGMELAKNFHNLDMLPGAFTGASQPALGYYTDLF